MKELRFCCAAPSLFIYDGLLFVFTSNHPPLLMRHPILFILSRQSPSMAMFSDSPREENSRGA